MDEMGLLEHWAVGGQVWGKPKEEVCGAGLWAVDMGLFMPILVQPVTAYLRRRRRS